MYKKITAFVLSLAMVVSTQLATFSNVPTLTASADETNLKIGDLNEDGTVNVLDLTTLKSAIIKGETSKVRDLNMDGKVDTADLLTIKKTILGLDTVKYYGYYFDGETLYSNGKLYTGYYTNSKGKRLLYVNGVLHTGYYLNEDDQKCYAVNGIPYTGFYADVLYAYGKPYTGIYIDQSGNQTMYEDGVFTGYVGIQMVTDSEGNQILYNDDNPYNGYYTNDDGERLIYVNGKPHTGYYLNENDKKCYAVDGVPYTGFYEGILYVDGKPYTGVYTDNDGVQELYVDGIVSKVDGLHVVTDDSGNQVLYDGSTPYSGFHLDNDGKQRIYVNGKVYTGYYLNENDVKCYAVNGLPYTGTFEGVLYSDGKPYTGLYTDGGLYVDGVLSDVEGFQVVTDSNGSTLLFKDSKLYSGFHLDDDGKQRIYVSGEIYTGYYLDSDSVKCYAVNGLPYTGTYDDILYVDGKPYTGTYTDNKTYQDGVVVEVAEEVGLHMVTDDSGNTLLYDGSTLYSGFYTDDNGTKKLYQSGKVYTGLYTNSSGAVNGYSDGTIVTGWATFDGSKYYFNTSTYKCATGVTSINGTNYYFNSEGKLLTNCVIGQWVVNSSGVATSSLQSKAQSVLSTYGKTPDKIYENYMRVYHKYKHISDSITLSFSATNDKVTPQIVNYTPDVSSVNATGWACFALYTIDRSQASCYYLAALQDYLFREAGYTSRIVYGTQGSGVHYWNQVLVSGTWLNYDACNSGRGGKTNSELSAINSAYEWCGYIVPDDDYNGCYYYNSTSDYSSGKYTYLVNSVYYTN